ncbi:MAG: hypothetical protein Q9166_002156 [cf. Caloplaca sp. 2 TL-2023]
MHELLLHGSIPISRHTQVLSILAGIAAMQPQLFHEKHLIYKPIRPVSRPTMQVGGSQAIQSKQSNPMQAVQGAMQGDLFYLHLVEDLVGQGEEGDEENRRIGGGDHPSSSTNNTTNWTLQFRDIPEVGNRRPVTTRLIADIPINGGDTAAFMSAMEYTHTSTHHLLGHRFTHNSTSILLFQPLIPPSPHHPTSTPTIQPLDPQTYILQLSIRISDGTNPSLMERGVKELISLKETLKGVVDVEIIERGVLDMRVK